MKVELIKEHTHKRVTYAIGRILTLSDDRAKRLVDNGIANYLKVKVSASTSSTKKPKTRTNK